VGELVLAVAVVGIWFATFYYGVLISGMYKDPLMAHFLAYGEERRTSPLGRFLVALGAWCWMFALAFSVLETLGARSVVAGLSLSFGMFGVMAFVGAWLVTRNQTWSESLPVWYADLMREATREERRLIAYAWFRLPRRLRWRFNGDFASFRSWVDLVRLTMVYGARSPDDPWKVWR
jgi:hypothetical protein